MAMIIPLLQTVLDSQSGSVWSRLITNPIRSVVPSEYILLTLCLSFVGLILLKNALILLKTFYSVRFVQDLAKHWTLKIKENYLYASYQFILNHKQGFLINNIILEPGNAHCRSVSPS